LINDLKDKNVSIGQTFVVGREDREKLPEDVRELASQILALASRHGVSEQKLSQCTALLGCVRELRPSASGPALIQEARELLQLTVRGFANTRDRDLLWAGLNLDSTFTGSTPRNRILTVWSDWDSSSPGYLTDESALDRFRNTLINRLAWRITGKSEWIPAESDLELARRYFTQGRFDQAEQNLRDLLVDERLSPTDRATAWLIMSDIDLRRGAYDGATNAVKNALEASASVERQADLETLIVPVDRLAVRLTDTEQYELAEQITTSALSLLPNSGRLWRRLGCIQWYAGELIGALAAFNAALTNGESRSHVIHERGQVLAELGQFRAAIEELTEALNYPRSKDSEAFALSTRAYAYGMTKDLKIALSDFAIAETVTPNNAWLYYFRGLCYLFNDMNDEAKRELQKSLTKTLPPLTHIKRERAKHLLAEMGG
jgi:tetratricopeptide (TPR) repeat protein